MLRRAAHAGALVFSAFWLMATSYAPMPRECYTGLDQGAVVRVLLGPAETARPSCAGADGLKEGATLELHLVQAQSFEGCRPYATQAISGPDGVTLQPGVGMRVDDELTVAQGTFQPSEVAGCNGTWRMSLEPVDVPEEGKLISPLDAGPTQKWKLTRFIGETSSGSCAPLLSAPRAGQGAMCEDTFAVKSITKVTATP
jgi:hypothetical protein